MQERLDIPLNKEYDLECVFTDVNISKIIGGRLKLIRGDSSGLVERYVDIDNETVCAMIAANMIRDKAIKYSVTKQGCIIDIADSTVPNVYVEGIELRKVSNIAMIKMNRKLKTKVID